MALCNSRILIGSSRSGVCVRKAFGLKAIKRWRCRNAKWHIVVYFVKVYLRFSFQHLFDATIDQTENLFIRKRFLIEPACERIPHSLLQGASITRFTIALT